MNANTHRPIDIMTSGHADPQGNGCATAAFSGDSAQLLAQLGNAADATLQAAVAYASHVLLLAEQQRSAAERIEGGLEALRNLETLHAPVAAIQGRLINLDSETSRLREGIRGVADRQEITDRNLEQLRRLAESLDRKIERLSGEFIDRHVTEPLLKEFFSIVAMLRSSDISGESPIGDAVRTVPDSLEQLMQNHGLSAIRPNEGEVLDPRLHQPIQTRPAPEPALHGCVAQTYQAGLRKSERIIQLARVAVFVRKESNR